MTDTIDQPRRLLEVGSLQNDGEDNVRLSWLEILHEAVPLRSRKATIDAQQHLRRVCLAEIVQHRREIATSNFGHPATLRRTCQINGLAVWLQIVILEELPMARATFAPSEHMRDNVRQPHQH